MDKSTRPVKHISLFRAVFKIKEVSQHFSRQTNKMCKNVWLRLKWVIKITLHELVYRPSIYILVPSKVVPCKKWWTENKRPNKTLLCRVVNNENRNEICTAMWKKVLEIPGIVLYIVLWSLWPVQATATRNKLKASRRKIRKKSLL